MRDFTLSSKKIALLISKWKILNGGAIMGQLVGPIGTSGIPI